MYFKLIVKLHWKIKCTCTLQLSDNFFNYRESWFHVNSVKALAM